MNNSSTHISFYFIAFALMLYFTACTKQTGLQDKSPIIAKAGYHTLTLNQAISKIPKQLLEADSINALSQYRRQWVRERILIDEANRRGLRDLPQFKERLETFADQLAMQLLMEQVYNSDDLPEVSRQEAIDYYTANRLNFVLEERHYRFLHITTETLLEANRARNELLNGQEWESIVERYAIDKMEALRSSESYVAESALTSEISDLAQLLPRMGLTEVSPIRQVNNQYHFIQLLDVRQLGETPEPEWAISRIKEWLTLDRRRKRLNSFELTLLKQAEANREIHFFD